MAKVKEIAVYLKKGIVVEEEDNSFIKPTGVGKNESKELLDSLCWLVQKKKKGRKVIGALWVSDVFYAEPKDDERVTKAGWYLRLSGSFIKAPCDIDGEKFDGVEIDLSFIEMFKEEGIVFNPFINQKPVLPRKGEKVEKEKGGIISYEKMTEKELRAECSEKGIKGFIRKTKKELIMMLETADRAGASKNEEKVVMGKMVKKSKKGKVAKPAVEEEEVVVTKKTKKSKKAKEAVEATPKVAKKAKADDAEKTPNGYRPVSMAGFIDTLICKHKKLTIEKFNTLMLEIMKKNDVDPGDRTDFSARYKAIVTGMARKGVDIKIMDGKVILA